MEAHTSKQDQALGFKSILAINLFFMIAFIMLRSSLTLFLKNHGYAPDETFSLVTTTSTLSAVSALVCGYFIRFLPTQDELVILGISIVAIGYILICSKFQALLPAGLAMYVVGSSFYFVNINLLVNAQFKIDTARQQGNHFYVIVFNIGALLGLLGFATTHSIQTTYLYAIASLAIAFVIAYLYRRRFVRHKNTQINLGKFLAILVGLLLASYFLLLHGALTRWLCLLLFAAVLAHLLYLARKEKQRKYYGFIVMLLLCSAMYWLSTEIFYSQFTVFLSNNVNNTFGHFTLMPLIYFSFDALSNIILGIAVYKLYKKYTPAPYKLLTLGVLLVACAFACIALPLYWYGINTKLSFIWPVFGIVFLGCSEFFLQSSTASQISFFATTPARRGYFMGLLRFTSAFAISVSFYLMTTTTAHNTAFNANTQLDLQLYTFMMVLALLAAIIYYVLCRYRIVEG